MELSESKAGNGIQSKIDIKLNYDSGVLDFRKNESAPVHCNIPNTNVQPKQQECQFAN